MEIIFSIFSPDLQYVAKKSLYRGTLVGQFLLNNHHNSQQVTANRLNLLIDLIDVLFC